MQRIRARALTLGVVTTVALTGCIDGDPPVRAPRPLTRLEVDRTYLRDAHGRYIFFHGVNASCTTKIPTEVDPDGIPTYVGRPFPLDRARQELARIRDAGFTAIRLLVIWEGIEPRRKGQYDPEYLRYIREIVQIAGEHGLYVLMDMHQDMFSRHLMVRYNAKPRAGEPGSIEHALLSLVRGAEGYTDSVQGDGAPRWAVQACLQEKKMSSPNWGKPRILSGMGLDELMEVYELYKKLTGADDSEPPEWVGYFLMGLPGKFEVDETSDLLPFTNWGVAHTLSLDVARCFACLLAGDKVFPGLKVQGQGVEDYLQEAYADAWAQVAQQVKDLPNVIGYDIMNEPSGNFIVLTAIGGMIKLGAVEGAKSALQGLLGQETGEQLYNTLLTLKILPPDTQPETLRKWGLEHLDVLAALELNMGFDDNHLRPFYERVGKAILKVDPRALIFIEGSMNIGLLTGGMGGIGGMWEMTMRHPEGLEGRVVFAPHWYTDIYPFIGFNIDPRRFTTEQVRYRDYQPKLEESNHLASYSLGNIPSVYGEFGTYFNFNNTYEDGKHVDNSRKNDYLVSAHILDNYYEAFERMFQSRIQWCYSSDNDPQRGDLWNREDFSVLGPKEKDGSRKLRAQAAWSRPHARALAGKPISTHFYSDLHYFDPDKGVQPPRREFEVRYGSRETPAPTEIVVPRAQYDQGFYVWISDGRCTYDPGTTTLYHFPSADEPGTEHWVRLRPPLPKKQNLGWSYFFRGDQMVGGR